VLIQVFLIAATLGLVVLLLQRRAAARTRAWKRLILVALAAAAVVSILNPDLTTRVANFVGVGRGTDLLLYLLVAVFLYVVVGFYLKFRDVERQLTVLARRLAIDEAIQRQQGIRVADASPNTADD
jgi:small membrane protein